MTYRHHIARLPRHQIARSVAVIERKILREQIAVHIVPHIVQKTLRTVLEVPQKDKSEPRPKKRSSNHYEQKLRKQVRSYVASVTDDVIHNESRYLGIYDGKHRRDRDEHKSHQHSPLVLFKVRIKPFHCLHFLKSSKFAANVIICNIRSL